MSQPGFSSERILLLFLRIIVKEDLLQEPFLVCNWLAPYTALISLFGRGHVGGRPHPKEPYPVQSRLLSEPQNC